MRLKTFDPIGNLSDLEDEYNNWRDEMLDKFDGLRIVRTHFAVNADGYPSLLVFWDVADEQA